MLSNLYISKFDQKETNETEQSSEESSIYARTQAGS